MSDPLPTSPTRELEHESLQQELHREQRAEEGDPELAVRTTLLSGLADPGWLRYDELAERMEFGDRAGEWKTRLWRLHNEGLVKVRWVGMTDPDPVEVKITARGREWLAELPAPGPARMPPPPPEGEPASPA